MSAGFWKFFPIVKADSMKLKNSLALVVITLLVLVIQGCASTGAPYQKTEVYADSSEDFEVKLARKLGKAEIGEVVVGVVGEGESAQEYTIRDEYTAASGNTCRNVDIANPETGAHKDALFCYEKGEGWYRAQDILLK